MARPTTAMLPTAIRMIRFHGVLGGLISKYERAALRPILIRDASVQGHDTGLEPWCAPQAWRATTSPLQSLQER
jgi:hypothetical protein